MLILKSEFLKIKRLWGLNLVFIFPLLITLASIFETLKKANLSGEINSISPMSSFYFQFFTTFSPMAILLIVFSLIQVENKNKMWESMVLLPVSKTRLYLSKLIIGILFVFIYILISYIMYLISSEIYAHIFPQISRLSHSDHMILLNFFSRMLLSFFLYTVISIPVFILIDSAVISLGILLFAIILSLFLTQQNWYIFYPFSYHITIFNTYKSNYEVLKDKSIWVVIMYAVLSVAIGLVSFSKLKFTKS